MNTCRPLWALLTLAWVVGSASAGSVRYLGPDEGSGSCRAVVVEGCALAHTGQLLPVDQQGNLIGETAVDAQLAQVLFNLEAALAAAGSATEHLVKLNLYVDSPRTADAVRKLFAKRFRKPVLPAMSWVCTPLAHPKALVALDAVAIVPGEGPGHVVRKRCESFAGDRRFADVAVLPRGETIYVCSVPAQGDSAAATAKALEMLMRTIGPLGLDHSHVVQWKVFLNAMDRASAVREQMASLFSGVLGPPGVLVESVSETPGMIELIAFAPAKVSTSAPAEPVSFLAPPGTKPSPLGSPLARVLADQRIYISGLYADQPARGEAQVRSVFSALEEIAKQSGTDLRHMVKATYYVADKEAEAALERLGAEYFDRARAPVSSKVMVHGVGLSDRSITLDMIAVPR